VYFECGYVFPQHVHAQMIHGHLAARLSAAERVALLKLVTKLAG
jgi:hypothetical protein